ncbi:MAG: sugar transferase [Ancrocorticia sp.]
MSTNAALSHTSVNAQIIDSKVELVQLPASQMVKRIADVVISLAVLVALALPAAVIALLIKRDSDGPVLAKRNVMGKNGAFAMYTFRTTKNPAWDTIESDQTRVGGFLRATGLFIIPQFLNVLLGDMSLVGPRPIHASSHRIVAHQIPGFTRRLAVRPGMTGLAQVKGAGDLSLTEELAYDHTYLAAPSLAADARIVAKALTAAFAS